MRFDFKPPVAVEGARLLTAKTHKTHKDKPEGTKTREDATKKHKDTENARYLTYNNSRYIQLHICIPLASTKTLQYHSRPDIVLKQLSNRTIIDINHDLLTTFIKDVMSESATRHAEKKALNVVDVGNGFIMGMNEW